MRNTIDRYMISAAQMRQIEGRIFAAGMPVAALMEKVAGLLTKRIFALVTDELISPNLPLSMIKWGILVGPGHNGGDALVVARELHLQGYNVSIYSPFSHQKELTHNHFQYAVSLGIPIVNQINELQTCDVIIDGLFGFGLEKKLPDFLIKDIDESINTWEKLVISIDIPSGIHTDTGAVLGTAIKANYTFCLGLWKLAFCQDQALPYIGKAMLIDFDIPLADITTILSDQLPIKRITQAEMLTCLPKPAINSHKYENGHLLLVVGSRRYTGAAILAGLGARASGVGMLSIAVPESIKTELSIMLPEAIVIPCPETKGGGMIHLAPSLDLNIYDAIGCGPGLTLEAATAIETVLESDRPLILDADGLNCLAQLGTIPILSERQAPTVITPHPGEFKRLFPELTQLLNQDRIQATLSAAKMTGVTVLLKGAKVVIATPDLVWLNPESTPALARGGSGDVLTGLISGLIANSPIPNLATMVSLGVWWHSQAGIFATQERTELGVDALTLTQYLHRIPSLRNTK